MADPGIIEKMLVGNVPTWVIVIFSAGVVWGKVNTLDKKVSNMKNNCETRLKWCLDHFRSKGNNNPTMKGGD